jgi:hypothetical protein
VVRFVRDQPDAYIYSSFGTRIFIAGFLLSLLYIGQGILVYTSTDKVMSLSSLLGRDSSADMMGQLIGGLILVTAVFVPMASSTMAISRWVLKRTYKKLEKMEVDSKRSQFLILLARFFFMGCIVAAYAPLPMIAESMMAGGFPTSSVNYYQTKFMSLFFTLFGIALFLTIISPILQLYRRTESRALILAGFLAIVIGGIMIYMGNGDWNLSIFKLDSQEFKSSFGTTMIICGICIFFCFWIVARNAKSILKYQRLHFAMKLGD